MMTSLTLLWNIGDLSRRLSSDISDTNVTGLVAPTPLASPQSSLRHRQDQGVPLPPSPPWSPAPVRQMVERSQKKKNRKSPMTRSGQRCHPSDKSRQVRMKLKVEVAGLQDRYGFALVSAALSDVKREMHDSLFHDVLGCRECWQDPVTRVYSYCPQSVHNPHHFAHCCPYPQDCPCDVDPFVLV